MGICKNKLQPPSTIGFSVLWPQTSAQCKRYINFNDCALAIQNTRRHGLSALCLQPKMNAGINEIFDVHLEEFSKIQTTAWKSLVTSYLAADVLFGCDNLVHVSSQSGIQLNSLGLTGFDQCFILTGGLCQHLSVHCIRDLEERVVQKHNRFGCCLSFCSMSAVLWTV